MDKQNNLIWEARKLLGISKSATSDEVKRRYRELARKWHPDLNKNKKAHKMMQKLNEAYELVMRNVFDIMDPWEDYNKWWWKQYGSDPIWGNNVRENDDNLLLARSKNKKRRNN